MKLNTRIILKVSSVVASLGMVLGGLSPRPALAATARVQYLSATNVYVDAGSAEGISESSTLIVKRGGKERKRA